MRNTDKIKAEKNVCRKKIEEKKETEERKKR